MVAPVFRCFTVFLPEFCVIKASHTNAALYGPVNFAS